MTDTAQPLPDETSEEGSLTPEMQQRAAALGIARHVLKSTAIFGQSGVQNWNVQDLLTVSDYILGVGPFVPLEGIGSLPIDSPENKADGTAITAEAGWWKPIDDAQAAPSALDDVQPADDEDEREAYDDSQDNTDVLPDYPEDALPR